MLRNCVSVLLFIFLAVGFQSRANGQFTVSPTSLDFGSPQAGSNPSPATQTATVTSQTSSKLNLSTSSNRSYISASVSPSSITGVGKTATVSVTVTSSGLQAGQYSGTVIVFGNGVGVQIQVTFSVSGVSISVSPSFTSVSVQAGSKTSATFSISGAPGQAVAVTAGGTGLSGGSTTGSGSFTTTVDATNLAAGNYSGTLTFSCTGGSPCLPAVVSVSITVTPVAPPVQLSVTRSSLSFQAYQGRPAPPPQALGLSATGGTATFSVQDVPPWLQVGPGAGTVSSSLTPVTVTVVPSALSPGNNNATFSFVSGTSSAAVNVNATFLSLSITANPAKVSPQLAPNQKQDVSFTFTTADGGSVAVTTSAATTQGGPWIKLAATTFTAPGPSPTVTIDATGLGLGTYSGSITFSCTQLNCGQTVVPVSLNVTNTAPPGITPGGLIVAGSFGGLKTVGPGTYIEIYGTNLAPSAQDWGQFFVNGAAPTSLEGVGVKINAEPAFVNYVSPGQINALLPADVSPGAAQVTVSNALGTSAPFAVTVAPQLPTLLAPPAFTIGNKQYVAGFLPPDYAGTFALPTGAVSGVTSRPAKPGETIVFYGLGFGPVNENVPVGTIAPGQATTLKSSLQIQFGQTAASVPYAGLAPGFVSLYQFNVVVPQVADNDAVPVSFTLAGTPGAQTLYIAVHQ